MACFCFQVTVSGVFDWDDLKCNFMSSCSVADVKTFISEEWNWPCYYFHLGCNGMKLSDDTSLSSLCTGDHLELDVHSFAVTVKSKESDPEQFEFPVTILGEHCSQGEQIIKGYVQAAKEFRAEDLVLYGLTDGQLEPLENWIYLPGETFFMEVRPKQQFCQRRKSSKSGQDETYQPATKVVRFT